MLRKVQFFIVTLLAASTVTAVLVNIAPRESQFDSLWQNHNTDNFLYCDYGFDTEKLYL